MPAVVRVKRHIDEEPLSAFVLNAKRRRVDSEEANQDIPPECSNSSNKSKQEINTLLKFAGTLKEQSDDKAITEYARYSRADAKNIVSKKLKQTTNVTEKGRHEMRKHAQEQRFRIVNCMRTTLDDSLHGTSDESQSVKELTIVDIEKQQQQQSHQQHNDSVLENCTDLIGCTSYNQNENEPQPSTSAAALRETNTSVDSDNGYVYDLYVTESEAFSNTDSLDLLEDYHISFRPIEFDFHGSYHRNNGDDDDDDDNDSEDSNREDYFTNDYPDEDDYDNDDDGDNDQRSVQTLTRAVEKFIFDDDDDDDDDDGDGDVNKDHDGSYRRRNKVSSSDDDLDYYYDDDSDLEVCSDIKDSDEEPMRKLIERHHSTIS